jgi:hypothetical protein
MAIWMGVTTVEKESAKVTLTGARDIAGNMQVWLGLGRFAVQPKLVAA